VDEGGVGGGELPDLVGQGGQARAGGGYLAPGLARQGIGQGAKGHFFGPQAQGRARLLAEAVAERAQAGAGFGGGLLAPAGLGQGGGAAAE
jgi:hypothetical protein